MEAADDNRRASNGVARNAGRVGIATAAAAHAQHASAAGAATAMKIEAAVIAAAATVSATVAEVGNAPDDLTFILAATAGTLSGAFASILAYSNVSTAQRMMRLGVSFFAGLLAAPYAIGHMPRPDSVPLAMHVFSVSGLCAFVAWSFVRAVQKRLGGIAEGVVDRVSPKQQKREKDDGGP